MDTQGRLDAESVLHGYFEVSCASIGRGSRESFNAFDSVNFGTRYAGSSIMNPERYRLGTDTAAIRIDLLRVAVEFFEAVVDRDSEYPTAKDIVSAPKERPRALPTARSSNGDELKS